MGMTNDQNCTNKIIEILKKFDELFPNLVNLKNFHLIAERLMV